MDEGEREEELSVLEDSICEGLEAESHGAKGRDRGVQRDCAYDVALSQRHYHNPGFMRID